MRLRDLRRITNYLATMEPTYRPDGQEQKVSEPISEIRELCHEVMVECVVISAAARDGWRGTMETAPGRFKEKALRLVELCRQYELSESKG